MKKSFLTLAVAALAAGSLAFASCSGKKAETASETTETAETSQSAATSDPKLTADQKSALVASTLVSEADFAKPIFIDFNATWCGPCRMVAPLLKSLAKEYKDRIAVYKVDTDKQKELSAVMGIQSLPTIIFIPKTGQPQIIIGAANKATFRKAIEEVLLKE